MIYVGILDRNKSFDDVTEISSMSVSNLDKSVKLSGLPKDGPRFSQVSLAPLKTQDSGHTLALHQYLDIKK